MRPESKSTPRLRATSFILGDRLPSPAANGYVEVGGPKIIISDFDLLSSRKVLGHPALYV